MKSAKKTAEQVTLFAVTQADNILYEALDRCGGYLSSDKKASILSIINHLEAYLETYQERIGEL